MRMTNVVWISLIILFVAGSNSFAQNNGASVVKSSIAAMPLQITFDKTSNLLFPYPIKSVDKGSKGILVQVAKGVENILQVKAARQGFDETNLTVVTADGKLYSFMVSYSVNPVALNIKIGGSNNYPNADALFSYKSDNEATVYDLARQISTKKPIIKNIRDAKYDVVLSLDGIYIKEDKLYFQLALGNNSNVDYSIDALRFFIVDVKKSKRTSFQEIELQPVESVGNKEIIRGQSKQTIVFTLPKFTIPEKQKLVVKMTEQNGGRHLGLTVKNKAIISAAAIK